MRRRSVSSCAQRAACRTSGGAGASGPTARGGRRQSETAVAVYLRISHTLMSLRILLPAAAKWQPVIWPEGGRRVQLEQHAK